MRKLALAVMLALLGLAVAIGSVLVVTNVLRPEPITFQRPAPGQARADYLPDGTPVWVIAHQNGSASVVSGFDTHAPFGIGKLLWWCTPARVLENPHHGSFWDEYGRRLGGPAPEDLPFWDTRVVGSRVALGGQRTADSVPVPLLLESERERCGGETANVVFHTFDDWDLWTSPREVLEAAPTGWILIEGMLDADPLDNRTIVCALDGCDDAAFATGIEVDPEFQRADFSPFGIHDRFIAQVRDGSLVNLTRVVWSGPQ